jgi:hypothetical protein
MAVSHAPAQPRKRKPLHPGRVYALYCVESQQHGKRGAYGRIAALLNVSDEAIRKVVQRHEAAITPKIDAFTKSETDYYPAPGQLAYEQQRVQLAHQLPVPVIHTATKDTTPTPPTIALETPTTPPLRAVEPPQTRTENRTNDLFASWSTYVELETETSSKVGDMASLSQLRNPDKDQPAERENTVPAHPKTPTKMPTTQEAPGAMETILPTQIHPTPISMHANYIQRRTAPRQRPIPVPNIHTIAVQLLQPGPVLAMVIFAILVGLMYWK